MAFWGGFGTEVKPGRPFTLAPFSGRLHLSQATLGMGSAVQKTIVQCNVGSKRPVYVCCLFPEKTECCQLNLEFGESDEVVFSVIGPRTVHLTGYYLPTSSLNHHNDESESYGEDIAETETERSENSEENEYGGSFINDDDPEVFPSSPESSAGSGSNEEILDLQKSKDGKGKRRRLRKKYKHSESENDGSHCQKDFTNVAAVEVLDSEMEDTLPISSLSRGKHASDGGKAAVEEKARKGTGSLNDNETQENATMLDVTNTALTVQPESGIRNEEKQQLMLCVYDDLMPKKKTEELPKEDCKHSDFLQAATQVGLEDGAKQKSKKKEHVNEKTLEDSVSNEDEGQKSGPNLDSVAHLEEKQTQKEVNEENEEKEKHMLGVDNDLVPKKKREGLPKEESYPEADHGMIENLVLEQNELPSKEDSKSNDTASQVSLQNGAKLKRKRKKLVKEKTLKDNVSEVDEGHKHGSSLDSITHLEDKETQKQVNDKKRKKKKRCMNKEDGDAMKMEQPVLSTNEKKRSDVEIEGKTVNENATQLQSGIIIEELETGKPDGKIASLGKKVYVHYIGKLKESGQVFDSSADKAPSKFHLGGKKVPDLWNVGLDGMRAGGKRRLTVPPSMRNEGAGENIPPNSWLVFDVELVKVR